MAGRSTSGSSKKVLDDITTGALELTRAFSRTVDWRPLYRWTSADHISS